MRIGSMYASDLGWGKKGAKFADSPQLTLVLAGLAQGPQPKVTGGQELLGLAWGGPSHRPPACTTFSE